MEQRFESLTTSGCENESSLLDCFEIDNKSVDDAIKIIRADIHSYVYDLFRRGRIDQAENLFRYLCIYDFYNMEYLMGLAAVFQLKAQYAQACELYAIAATLSDTDYRPVFHAGHCHLAMHESARARQCFIRVLENSRDESLCALSRASLEAMSETRTEPEAGLVADDDGQERR